MKHARKDYQENIQAPEGMIPADEPVFLLRAQDVHAASTVRYWANRVYAAGGQMDVIQAAHQIAEEMDAWPVKKAPDLPE